MGDSRAADALTTDEFERLVSAAETYREELVVELCGAVGLRPVEIARVRPADLLRRDYGTEHDFLRVSADGARRNAYVPPDVADDVRKYAEAAGVDDEEPLFDVTPRRLQMLVSAVAERADDGTGGLADASTSDLRAHFARRLLREEGVDPRIVQATGGWSRLGSLEPYVEPPADREVAAALSGTDDGSPSGETSLARRAPSFEAASALGAALEGVSTRAEVERRACEEISSAYGPTGVCGENGDVRAWAGPTGSGARESVTDAMRDLAPSDGEDPARFVERELDADPWGPGRTLAASAIRSGDRVHGLLCVVTGGSTPETGLRRFLVDAGRRLGWAVAATERKELLLSDAGVELVFEATDGSFFATASRDLDCRLDLEGAVPAAGRSLLCFVTASGAPIEALLDSAAEADAVSDARLIRDAGERVQLEFVVDEPSPMVSLVERGGAIEALTASDGTARVSAFFASQHDVRAVVEHVTSAFPGVAFHAKREAARHAPEGDLHRTLEESLTEKQRSTLRAAYFAGYFQWPRGSTAEELADSMDVSAPTLHNHLRKAQQKVFTALFDSG